MFCTIHAYTSHRHARERCAVPFRRNAINVKTPASSAVAISVYAPRCAYSLYDSPSGSATPA